MDPHSSIRKEKGLEKVEKLKKYAEEQELMKTNLFESGKILSNVGYQVNLFQDVIDNNTSRVIDPYVDPDQSVVFLSNYLKQKWSQL